MKRICSLLMICLIGGLMTSQAQDRRTMETRVADILAQMPTHDLPHLNRLMQEMITLGDSGLDQFTQMIVAPGTGDDTRVRFALANLAHFSAQNGRETERLMVSESFIRAVRRAADPGVRQFFFYHLNFVGKDEAVPLAADFLNDTELVDDAVAFLEANRSRLSLQVMLDAVNGLREANRVAVIESISTFCSPEALPLLTELAADPDPQIRRASLHGLARIGDPSSHKVLVSAAKDAGYAYDVTRAVPALVAYAETLARKGEVGLTEKIGKLMIKKCTGAHQLHYALAATGVLVDQLGYEAMDYLLDGIRHPEKHYRGGILRHAANIQDIAATRKWMEVYQEVNPEVQAELLTFFGLRGDALVLPLVREAVGVADERIQKEALVALGRIQGREAIPMVLDQMSQGGAERVKVAQQVLQTLVGPDELSLLADSFSGQTKEGQIAILELLSWRQAKNYFDLVRVNLGNADPDIRNTAYEALQRVSSARYLPELLQILYRADHDDYLLPVQQAVVAAAQELDNPAAPVLKAYEAATQNQYRFMGILPKLGGDAALQVVSEAFETGNKQLKEQAFEALVNWKDYSASRALFTICASQTGEYKQKAFSGYVRQIREAPVPADQRLLLLKKIYPQAERPAQKEAVIGALQGNKTFLTLIWLGELMQEPGLGNAAARVAAEVALPPSGTKEGMYGAEVKRVLQLALSKISGEEADYVKANIRSWLETMPADEGFVAMFNGKNLDGWQGLVKNPIARDKMSASELAREQEKANAKLPENWSVVNGEIRFTGTGYENLCSVRDYGDVEMIVDWRISKNGDSGIYLRGTPQVQIWDTSRVEVGAQVGSGGLYNNQIHPSKPLVVADNPINDWNTFRIIMVGERVTVYLNGILVTDQVVLENYWDRSLPIFANGPIELQAHGTDLAFRNVYVREIKSGDYNLSVEERADGFVSLFNGKNLDGWIGNKTDYVVEEGVIVIRPKRGGHGNLYTEKEYADFQFRFEFQLTPGANNGLGIRTPPEGDAAYTGMELQILDNTAPIYTNLEPYQYHGSVYGVIPAKRGFLKPVGEWNVQEVIAQGTRIKIILNGETIVDGDLAVASENGTMDHRDHPGLFNEKGHIGFLGHGSVVKFRNIRIKEL